MRQAMIQLMKEAVTSIKDWNGSSIDRINDYGSRIGKTNESGSIFYRTNQRGSIIETTNESDSNFDIAKETAPGINTTIYENSAYSIVITVNNNIVTNLTINEDEKNTGISIILILKNQYLKKRLRLKWMS